MISGFEKLSESQFEIVKDSIAWITVLIAGADGKIDEEETEWAKKLTKIRGYSNPNALTPFYDEVGLNFDEKLTSLISNVPTDTQQRTDILSRKLSQLNEILPQLDNALAFSLYESYKTFAKHVAESSGGFLRFFTVNSEEAALINLPMVTPIELVDSEEE